MSLQELMFLKSSSWTPCSQRTKLLTIEERYWWLTNLVSLPEVRQIVGSKDKLPPKWRAVTNEKIGLVILSLDPSINYTCLEDIWKQNKIIIDDVFAYVVVAEIVKSNDIEQPSIVEA